MPRSGSRPTAAAARTSRSTIAAAARIRRRCWSQGRAPRQYRVTGVNYLKVPVDEQLDDEAGVLRWTSDSDRGGAADGSGWYLALQVGIDPIALLARGLLHAPGHRLKLLPAGEAWIDDHA